MFISFEGIDASGKDTAALRLYQELLSRCASLVTLLRKRWPVYAQPSMRPYVQAVSDVCFTPDPIVLQAFPKEYWIMLAAAWYCGYHHSYIRALRDSGIVIINNWYYKMMARYEYKGCERDWLKGVFTPVPTPDYSVFLDVPAEIASTRRSQFTPVECGVYDGTTGGLGGFITYQNGIGAILREYASEHGWIMCRNVSPEIAVNEVLARIGGDLSVDS